MNAKLIICLLAVAVAFAATTARLSLYRSILAPTGAMANSVKMSETRVQKVSIDASDHAVDNSGAPSEASRVEPLKLAPAHRPGIGAISATPHPLRT